MGIVKGNTRSLDLLMGTLFGPMASVRCGRPSEVLHDFTQILQWAEETLRDSRYTCVHMHTKIHTYIYIYICGHPPPPHDLPTP